MHLLAELVVAHRRARDADHREPRRQASLVRQTVKRGQQFPLGQVLIGAKDDHHAFRNAALEPKRVLKRILQRHVSQSITARPRNYSLALTPQLPPIYDTRNRSL